MTAPRRTAVFRPRFTLMVFWFALFFFGFCLLFVLPEMIEGAETLPASGEELSDEEMARGREIAHNALSRLEMGMAFLLALCATGLGTWRKALPGLRG